MSEITKKEAVVYSAEKISEDIYSMWIVQPQIVSESKPGQFLSLFCRDGSRLLPRPISICEINKEKGMLRLVYRIAGEGTKEFSNLKKDDGVFVMGPLGNGFTLEGNDGIFVGGGIGIPPMLELVKQFKGNKKVVLGYRDFIFLKEEFEQYAEVFVATEDGSVGTKGNVIDAMKAFDLKGDMIYSCGPTPMLRGIKEYAINNDIEAQLSLEEHMACGIGACLACVCKSKDVDEHTHVHNKRVCKDGPVFYAREVEL